MELKPYATLVNINTYALLIAPLMELKQLMEHYLKEGYDDF